MRSRNPINILKLSSGQFIKKKLYVELTDSFEEIVDWLHQFKVEKYDLHVSLGLMTKYIFYSKRT